VVSTHLDCLAALFVATLISRSGLWLLSIQSAAEILGFLNNGGCGPRIRSCGGPMRRFPDRKRPFLARRSAHRLAVPSIYSVHRRNPRFLEQWRMRVPDL